MGNIADVIDAILSKENLSSNTPRIIEGNENLKKLSRCLNGNGDLFEEFITNDIKTIIEPLAYLYTIYTPVKNINEKLNIELEKKMNIISYYLQKTLF